MTRLLNSVHFRTLFLLLFTVFSTTALESCLASTPLPAHKLPAKAAAALANSTQVTLYLLGSEEDTSDKGFHGYKVLGKTDLSKSDAKKATGAFHDAIVDWNEGMAECYIPRHALRINADGHAYDYLYCYYCNVMNVYEDGKHVAELFASGSPDIFNALLTTANVPPEYIDNKNHMAAEKKHCQAAEKDAYDRWFADFKAEQKNIPRKMFPNAREKTASLECFRSLTPKMSVYEVVSKCGRPDEEVGSGVSIFVWNLRDGSTVVISTPYMDRIYDAHLTDSSGKNESLLHAK